ncbi:Uricase [Neolecta irregularis DAH-3]|uniref:Uricase n=1 Tax=Neolecta irregularis (strain DAH-3) TaxID=1198029 RepID=A0A1U7LRB4_NEOID|nr:Uricase [Neolecta irregularis DAH-3]|eukprot:OLL25169.1 Uricase [Neolecta irregularis DAH-3]
MSVKQASYGKDFVRVLKVIREAEGKQTVVEMTVRTLLSVDTDEFKKSYTEGDNSLVIATDTQKNTVNVLAKQHDVQCPEVFATIVANHFVEKYSHIHVAEVSIIQNRWSRMIIDGKSHPHSFYRDGNDVRSALVTVDDKKGITIKSGIKGLLVLKSTGSAFYGFHRDELTTLAETNDRIFSTKVDCQLLWNKFWTLDEVKLMKNEFMRGWNVARDVTMRIFATDESASVQNTLYKMCCDILRQVMKVEEVNYSLPNKHYVNVDLKPFGLRNEGKEAEVFLPLAHPSGLITATVARKSQGKI